MFETFKARVQKAKYIAMTATVAGLGMVLPASATVDFSALTDLINATFDVLDTIVTNQSTLISIVVLGGILGLIGIIIYGFVGKLLQKVANLGGGMGKN